MEAIEPLMENLQARLVYLLREQPRQMSLLNIWNQMEWKLWGLRWLLKVLSVIVGMTL